MQPINPGLQLHTTSDADLASRLARSSERMHGFLGKHTGQRCVIIGNGPSLNQMDLSFLKNEITFGMNRIYLGFDKWGFRPTYFVSVNSLVLEQSHQQIVDQIDCPKFISQHGHKYFADQEDIFLLKSIDAPFFSRDITQGVWEGYTVTYVAMQIAFSMGFSEVVLIGVDHNFVSQGKPNQEVVANGPDLNHFDAGYFDKGVRWHLPDLDHSEMAYNLAKWVYLNEGRQIIDATANGKLQVFPKMDYQLVFDQAPSKTTPVAPLTKDDAPLVSVLCPFTDEHELSHLVNQIEHQTYPNLSPTFINLGHENHQPFLTHALADRPLTYIYKNQWMSTAEMRNTGLACANDQYIAYFNPGSEYHPDHLAIQALTLKYHPQEQAAYSLPPCNPEPSFQKEIDWDGITVDDLLIYPYLSLDCLMHQRSASAALGGFDMRLADLSDWDFLIRMFLITNPAFIRLQTYQRPGQSYIGLHGRDLSEDTLQAFYQKYEKLASSSVLDGQKAMLQHIFGRSVEIEPEKEVQTIELENLLLEANKAVEHGDLSSAAQHLSQAISLVGTDAWLLNTRANIYLAMKEFQAAAADFCQVLNVNQSDIPALGGMATCLLMQQDYSSAAEYAQRALALEPHNQEIQNLTELITFQSDKRTAGQGDPSIVAIQPETGRETPMDGLKVLQENWETFGSQDPMWAILTRADKKGNRWQPGEFFETGINDIQQMLAYLRSINVHPNRGSALDFGCGYGRLTQAFAMEFDQVYGIDIAPSMIAGANAHNRFGKRCQYILNDQDNLSFIPTSSIDLVYSLITLQHIRPQYSRNYLKEFARILAPGGVLIFQLPSRRLNQIVQTSEPARFDPANPVMEMHGIPKPEVLELLQAHGVTPFQIHEDRSLGSDWESYRYFMVKHTDQSLA